MNIRTGYAYLAVCVAFIHCVSIALPQTCTRAKIDTVSQSLDEMFSNQITFSSLNEIDIKMYILTSTARSNPFSPCVLFSITVLGNSSMKMIPKYAKTDDCVGDFDNNDPCCNPFVKNKCCLPKLRIVSPGSRADLSRCNFKDDALATAFNRIERSEQLVSSLFPRGFHVKSMSEYKAWQYTSDIMTQVFRSDIPCNSNDDCSFSGECDLYKKTCVQITPFEVWTALAKELKNFESSKLVPKSMSSPIDATDRNLARLLIAKTLNIDPFPFQSLITLNV